MLALLAVTQLLGMAPWLAGSVVADELVARGTVSVDHLGWITGAVQLGFVIGTALSALLNLADILPGGRLFAVSAIGAAVTNQLMTSVDTETAVIAARFGTGFFLAGVYPPALKMTATWFRSRRGLAIGTVIGALVLGKAAPWFIRSLEGTDLNEIVTAISLGTVLAAILVGLLYRDGPHTFARRPFSFSLATIAWTHVPTRRAIGGYLGHMWELYAMWTWVPTFIAASLAARGLSGDDGAAELLAFGAIASGSLGCVAGGWLADRIGRARLVTICLAASGLCCILVGPCFGGPVALLAAVTWVWGFFVVADSAQFSTMVTEATPPHAVGTVLTVQTSTGFLLTTITIDLVPRFQEFGGWPWAFPILVLGPVAGIWAVRAQRAR